MPVLVAKNINIKLNKPFSTSSPSYCQRILPLQKNPNANRKIFETLLGDCLMILTVHAKYHTYRKRTKDPTHINLFLLCKQSPQQEIHHEWFGSNDYHGTRYNVHLDACGNLEYRCMDFHQLSVNIHCNAQDRLENNFNFWKQKRFKKKLDIFTWRTIIVCFLHMHNRVRSITIKVKDWFSFSEIFIVFYFLVYQSFSNDAFLSTCRFTPQWQRFSPFHTI